MKKKSNANVVICTNVSRYRFFTKLKRHLYNNSAFIYNKYIITLYAFIFENVRKYKWNNETFKILLYFDFLSNEIWRIKDSGHYPKVKWEIVKKWVPYNPQTKRCLLCLNGKLETVAYKEQNLLNKRDKIASKCRHQLKYAPARYDAKD